MQIASNGSQWAIAGPSIRHQAVRVASAGKTFFAYQGTGFEPHVVAIDDDGTVDGPVVCGSNPLVSDSHGTPSLVVDDDGYLHVFYGCHNTSLLYSKSSNPLDISSWASQPAVVNDATYPSAFNDNGTLRLLYRAAGGHVGDWVERTSTNGGASWTSPVQVINGVAPRMAFYCDWYLDSAGTMHCALCWKDETNGRGYSGAEYTHRAHVYYLRRHAGDTAWRNIQNQVVNTPANDVELNAKCTVENTSNTFPRSNVPAVTADENGIPHIVAVRGDSATWDVSYYRWTGSNWQRTPISNTDHQFDGYDIRAEGGTLTVLAISGGTSGTEGVSGASVDRGGHVWKCISTDGGNSWNNTSLLTDRKYNYPIFVPGNNVSRYLVAEWPATIDSFDGVVLAQGWGEPDPPPPSECNVTVVVNRNGQQVHSEVYSGGQTVTVDVSSQEPAVEVSQ